MMSAETQAILTTYAKAFEQIMVNSLPRVTGKTIASISSEVTTNRMRGYGRPFIHATETGRGPRESSKYSGFDKGLEEYLNARGLETKTSKKGIKYYKIGPYWFSAKSLAWKINAKGDKKFRSGGTDLYSDKLDLLLIELTEKIENQKHKEYSNELIKQLGSLSNKAA